MLLRHTDPIFCNLKQYKSPNHKAHIVNFIMEYSSARGRVPKTIILVDPKDCAVALENPTLNTTECYQASSLAEDIAQAEKGIGITGLGVRSCQ